MALARERVETPDGDFLDLDFAESGERGGSPNVPVVLVLHGLEGSSESKYALEAHRGLAARGLQGVGLNFRSCSGELNRTKRLYHSGETGDLAYVLDLLARRFPGSKLGAIGFSLGGNVLLKYLGETGSDDRAPLLSAAVAISVPFDLGAGADYLERGLSRLYRWRLVRSLQQKVRAKAGLLGDAVDLQCSLAARTFREFDDAATAPLHGFAGAEDYYRRSSSAPYLSRVRVPTLVIHSLDDPFLPAAAVPQHEASGNPNIVGVFTKSGGHVGFVSGEAPWAPAFWAEQEATRFVSVMLGP